MSSRGRPEDTLQGVGLGLRWDFLEDLLERIDQGRIGRAEIPFFEISPENYLRRGGYIPESLSFVAEHFPVITHGLAMSLGGFDGFDDDYFAELRAIAHEVGTPWHSDHLCFCGTDGRALHELLPLPRTEGAALHVAGRVREARDRLELPLAVENISYYVDLAEPELAEHEWVATVLDAADCTLLLDVNNVYVNSLNHGFDARAWIASIDMDRVCQLHVAGHEHRPEDGLVVDTHGAPVIDPVYDLLRFTIGLKGAVPVILERDNDVPDLDTLLAERARLQDAYEQGLAAYRELDRAS